MYDEVIAWAEPVGVLGFGLEEDLGSLEVDLGTAAEGSEELSQAVCTGLEELAEVAGIDSGHLAEVLVGGVVAVVVEVVAG